MDLKNLIKTKHDKDIIRAVLGKIDKRKGGAIERTRTRTRTEELEVIQKELYKALNATDGEKEEDLEKIMEKYDLTTNDLPASPPKGVDVKELARKIGRAKRREDRIIVAGKEYVLKEELEEEKRLHQKCRDGLEGWNPPAKKEIKRLLEENDGLKQQVEYHKNNEEALRKELEGFKEGMDSLESFLDKAAEKEDKLGGELMEKEETIDKLKEVIEERVLERDWFKRELKKEDKVLTVANQTSDKLLNDLKEERNKNLRIEEDLSDTEDEVELLMDKINEKDKKIKELEGKKATWKELAEIRYRKLVENSFKRKDQSEVEKITERFLKEYREALERLADK